MIRIRLLKRLGRNGFNLVEMMTVIAIISILTAISVPNYNAFRKKAQYAVLETTLHHLMDGQDLYLMENSRFYPEKGKIKIAKGAYKQINKLAYTFPKGHAHQYRIRGFNNKKNNRYIIDVWSDYDFNGNGKKDRIQVITWLKNGQIYKNNDRKIRHWK